MNDVADLGWVGFPRPTFSGGRTRCFRGGGFLAACEGLLRRSPVRVAVGGGALSEALDRQAGRGLARHHGGLSRAQTTRSSGGRRITRRTRNSTAASSKWR